MITDERLLEIATRQMHPNFGVSHEINEIAYELLRLRSAPDVGEVLEKMASVMETHRVSGAEADCFRCAKIVRSHIPAKPAQLWCAMCGKYGDHTSGTCPELMNNPTPVEQKVEPIEFLHQIDGETMDSMPLHGDFIGYIDLIRDRINELHRRVVKLEGERK